MKRLRLRPQLEELEAKVLPSGTALTAPALAGSQAVPPAVHHHHHHHHHHATLAGTMHGIYTFGPLIPDVGPHYQLSGSGWVGLLGWATVDGSIQGVGFIKSGRATGTLTLHGKKGDVTLQLTGPVQPGFSALPTHFSFKVVGGTGAYKHYKASGSVDLKFTPSIPIIDPPVNAEYIPFPGGTFSLTIHPGKG